MSKKVGVLGTGGVGVTLANGLRSIGYDVTLGSRKSKKVEGWNGPVAAFAEAVNEAELAVLAVKGIVAEELVASLKDKLAGITVIDTTNPITDDSPVNGVLSYFTDINKSLMERLQ